MWMVNQPPSAGMAYSVASGVLARRPDESVTDLLSGLPTVVLRGNVGR